VFCRISRPTNINDNATAAAERSWATLLRELVIQIFWLAALANDLGLSCTSQNADREA
jgi:hypothetical protein